MDNTNKVYNYLVETLGAQGANVEQLPNGGYYVSNWTGKSNWGSNELYIPPNFNSSNVTVVAHLPGSGGSRNDAIPIRETFMGENAPDYIVAISSHSSDNAQVLDCVSNICSDNNVNITDVSLTTFSASGAQGFISLENFLEKNPNTNATMFVADGYNLSPNGSHVNDLDSLVESKTPVYLVMPENNQNRLSKVAKELIDKGVDVRIITSDRSGHVDINHDLIRSYMAEYSIGLVDELQGENLEKCDYTI